MNCKITGTKKRIAGAKEHERNAAGNFLKEYVPSETITAGHPVYDAAVKLKPTSVMTLGASHVGK